LEAPKILVATGDGVSATSYGALKFLFEQTFEIDDVPVAVSRLKPVVLRGFNGVFLPINRVTESAGMERLASCSMRFCMAPH